MAETTTGSTGPGNKVPHQGDHDRVSMLSLKADGTPDQHNPEIIGDKESAVEAAKVQFAQQAVSAADVRRQNDQDGVTDAPQDPSIAEAQKEHEKVASAAEKAAESAVKSLHKG